MGTPLFMSPEQCRGGSDVTASTDLYALGCMLFQMLTGRPPFLYEAPGDLLVAHMTEPAPTASSFEPRVPAELDALVTRLLQKLPAQRPSSMVQVAEIFRALGNVPLQRVSAPSSLPHSELPLHAEGNMANTGRSGTTLPPPAATTSLPGLALGIVGQTTVLPAPKANTPVFEPPEASRLEPRNSVKQASRKTLWMGLGAALAVAGGRLL